MTGRHVAIDLGAGSGRAFLGHVDEAGLALEELHRFTYGPRPSAGCLRWDMTALHRGLVAGLAAARERAAREAWRPARAIRGRNRRTPRG